MRSFVSPYGMGSYYNPGTPERYSMPNRYAYRMRNSATVEQPEPVVTNYKQPEVVEEEEEEEPEVDVAEVQQKSTPAEMTRQVRREDPYTRRCKYRS